MIVEAFEMCGVPGLSKGVVREINSLIRRGPTEAEAKILKEERRQAKLNAGKERERAEAWFKKRAADAAN